MRKLLIASLLLLLAAGAYADSADVSIRFDVDGDLPRAPLGTAFFAWTRVTNLGPDTAHDIVVTSSAPGAPGTHVQSPNIATLAPNDYKYVGVVVDSPAAVSTFALTVSVSSATPDPQPSNNSVTGDVRFVLEPNLLLFIEPIDFVHDPETPTRFLLSLFNDGNAAAPDVAVDVAFPAGTSNIIVPSGSGCSVDGTNVHCAVGEMTQGATIRLTITATSPPIFTGGLELINARIASPVEDLNPANNVATARWDLLPFYSVTNTADSGPGSLRQAIIDANAQCVKDPCRIGFHMPLEGNAIVTIVPETALPQLTGHIAIDGTTAKQFNSRFDTHPIVLLDGSHAASGNGIDVRGANGSVIGMAIGGFAHGAGVFVYAVAPGSHSIQNDFLGTDATGEKPLPNFRGVMVAGAGSFEIRENVIRTNIRSGVWLETFGAPNVLLNDISWNGGSGIYVAPTNDWAHIWSNVIVGNVEFGIAVHPATKRLNAPQNRIFANGNLGIDIGIDLETPNVANDSNRAPNTPVLTSATYDPATGLTTIEGDLHSLPSAEGGERVQVYLYANTQVTNAQAEEVLNADLTWDGTGTHFTATLKRDLRGKSITGVTFRYHMVVFADLEYNSAEQTSEISRPVFVK